jgi:uncharacterized protein
MSDAEPAPEPPEPDSPCLRICRLDPDSRLCTGCGRTAREIARWSMADAEEKWAILAEVARRRAAEKE